MNKTQAKRLGEARDLVQRATSLLEELRDDLQAAFDDKSERWQESERGEAVQEQINTVEGAASSLEDITANLESLDLQ